MSLGTLIKRPADYLDYDVVYNRWLYSGDSIVRASASLDLPSAKTEKTEFDENSVKIWVSGGHVGETLTITIVIETAQGRKKTDSFFLRIRETC